MVYMKTKLKINIFMKHEVPFVLVRIVFNNESL